MSHELNQLPELRLKRGEDRRLSAGHLWVFSNEVDTARTPLPSFEPGSLCRVLSDRDKFLGYAYVNPRSLICARILGRDPEQQGDDRRSPQEDAIIGGAGAEPDQHRQPETPLFGKQIGKPSAACGW